MTDALEPDVSTDDGRAALIQQLEAATDRLLQSVVSLDDPAVRQNSLLPGWTRAHVLAHLAGNAEALTNLLRGARTGTPAVAYASQDVRDAAIEEGSRRPAADLVADLAETARVFRSELDGMPARAWVAPVRLLTGPEFPAAGLIVRRLVEVELHHVDLDLGYTWQDWPSPFADYALAEPMRSWRADRMSGGENPGG